MVKLQWNNHIINLFFIVEQDYSIVIMVTNRQFLTSHNIIVHFLSQKCIQLSFLMGVSLKQDIAPHCPFGSLTSSFPHPRSFSCPISKINNKIIKEKVKVIKKEKGKRERKDRQVNFTFTLNQHFPQVFQYDAKIKLIISWEYMQ